MLPSEGLLGAGRVGRRSETEGAECGSSLRLRRSMSRKQGADIPASPAARCEGVGVALLEILSVAEGRPFAGLVILRLQADTR